MSYEIVKRIKPIQNGEGKWGFHVVGHCNNIYPRKDREYECGFHYGTKDEAEASILLDSFHGEVKGSNRYTTYMVELELGIAKSDAYERLLMLDRLRYKVFNLALAYSTKYVKQDGIEKDNAKAERASQIESRIRNRMEGVCLELLAAMRKWKPDRARYLLGIEGANGLHYVTKIGKLRYWYNSSHGDTTYAKRFSRIAAERAKRSVGNSAKAVIVDEREAVGNAA